MPARDGTVTGYIKIWRDMLSHWVWNREPWTTGQLWCYLIAWAVWDPKGEERDYQKCLFRLKRGQLVTTVMQLARVSRRTRNWARNQLHLLETGHMIERKRDRGCIVVSICNYDAWQGGVEMRDTHRTKFPTPEGHPSVHLRDTDRRREEGKKERNARVDAYIGTTGGANPTAAPPDPPEKLGKGTLPPTGTEWALGCPLGGARRVLAMKGSIELDSVVEGILISRIEADDKRLDALREKEHAKSETE